jgi:hypothetical protein
VAVDVTLAVVCFALVVNASVAIGYGLCVAVVIEESVASFVDLSVAAVVDVSVAVAVQMSTVVVVVEVSGSLVKNACVFCWQRSAADLPRLWVHSTHLVDSGEALNRAPCAERGGQIFIIAALQAGQYAHNEQQKFDCVAGVLEFYATGSTDAAAEFSPFCPGDWHAKGSA